jgi:hypothetical protein
LPLLPERVSAVDGRLWRSCAELVTVLKGMVSPQAAPAAPDLRERVFVAAAFAAPMLVPPLLTPRNARGNICMARLRAPFEIAAAAKGRRLSRRVLCDLCVLCGEWSLRYDGKGPFTTETTETTEAWP